MVQAFHAAGIEVWLDVVYNHTAEASETGPTYSYRGIDNSSYYLLTSDRRHYVNDTGCGNTVQDRSPVRACPGARKPPLLGRRLAWMVFVSILPRFFHGLLTAR